VLLALVATLLLSGCAASSAPTWQSSGPQQAPALIALAVDQNHPQTIFAGSAGSGVYRSTDGGSNWALANSGLPHVYVICIVTDPALPGQVYLGTDQGVFLSSDDGDHWQGASLGLPTDVAVHALAVNPADSLTLYAGTDHQGVYLSHDGAKTWSASSTGLPANVQVHTLLAVQSGQGTQLYAGLLGAGVYRSDDGGSSWSASSTDQPAATDGLSLLWQPSNPGGVYLGTNVGLYRSTDAGASWQAVNDGLGQPTPQVLSLALNAGQPQFLYAGTSSGAYLSADGGASWSQVARGLPTGQAVTSLAVAGSRTSLGQVYAAVGTVYRYPGGAFGIANTIITVVLAGLLILLFLWVFRQQRRLLHRAAPRSPDAVPRPPDATGAANAAEQEQNSARPPPQSP
jgi:ligand-binding sensor domain-containing protein